MHKPTLRLIAALVSVVLLAACGDDDDETGTGTNATDGAGEVSAPDGLVNEGALTVCSDTPYEPFEFKNDAGEDTGYDIDLLREVASSASLDLEVIDLPFDGILGSLEAGQCDVVASAVTITEERAEQVDFSEPYFDAEQSLLIKADQQDAITELADLEGKTLGVQSGTTGEEYAKEHATGAEIKAFEDSDGLFAALEAGEIVGILQDLPVNGYRSTQDASVVVLETYPTEEQYGFAVKKGSTEVLEFINSGLDALRDDGTFDEIYSTYFGDAES